MVVVANRPTIFQICFYIMCIVSIAALLSLLRLLGHFLLAFPVTNNIYLTQDPVMPCKNCQIYMILFMGDQVGTQGAQTGSSQICTISLQLGLAMNMYEKNTLVPLLWTPLNFSLQKLVAFCNISVILNTYCS